MCKSEAIRMLELTNNCVFFVTSFKNYLVLFVSCLFISFNFANVYVGIRENMGRHTK